MALKHLLAGDDKTIEIWALMRMQSVLNSAKITMQKKESKSVKNYDEMIERLDKIISRLKA